MKRRDLIRALAAGARSDGVAFELVREGAKHSVFRYGTELVPIPRHAEINERLARAILRGVGLDQQGGK